MSLIRLIPLLLVFGLAFAQNLRDPLESNPALIMGKLPNGLTYYIQKNAEPKNRMELRLAVNAGSIQEDDDQKGLAHFLEHMLFNGTKRFPKQEIVNYLEGIGMTFGPDLNAYTSFDETVYILKVPTDKSDIVQKAFDILEDWAGSALVEDSEVKREAPIIIEEERARNKNAGGRINKQLYDFLLKNSRYAERLPIGDMNIVRPGPTEALRRYYQTWYRPDLMAVMAVGDFDPKQIEAIIQKNFSGLKNPATPRPRPSYSIPSPQADGFLVVSDPEYTATQVELNVLQPAGSERTVGDLRERVKTQLLQTLLNARLDELVNSAKAPFLSASAQRGGFVRTTGADSVSARAKEGEEAEAVGALVAEVRRAHLGFTASELARAKQNLLSTYEKNYNERDKRTSDQVIRELITVFLQNRVSINPQVNYDLGKKFIGEIFLNEINDYAKTFLVGPRLSYVIRPEKAGLAPLSADNLKAIVAQADARPVEAYKDTVVQSSLMEQAPAPVAIAKNDTQKEFTELVLANGARVLYKTTDFKADEVLFQAISLGGASLVSDEDYVGARVISEVVDQSGVANFDRPQITRILAGRRVSVTPFIDERSEGLRGNSTTKDLELLFQLAHLYFTSPKADAEVFERIKKTQLENVRNRSLNPISALQDALNDYRFGNSIRGKPYAEASLQNLNLGRALQIYKERFADASDFSFVFVGNFDEAKLKDLAQRYLGSLPAKNSKENWKQVFFKTPYAKQEKSFNKGKDERGTVVQLFGKPVEYNQDNAFYALALQDLLNIRYTEELREKLGGVYGAGVQVVVAREPYVEIRSLIQFVCDPKRAEELAKASLGVLEEVKTKGVSEANMNKVREQLRRSREEAQRTNNFWLGRLANYAQYPDFDVNDIQGYFDRASKLKSEDLQKLAQQLYTDNYLQAILFPEKQ